jgi:hypothetical protein
MAAVDRGWKVDPTLKINLLRDLPNSFLYLILTQFQESIFLPPKNIEIGADHTAPAPQKEENYTI